MMVSLQKERWIEIEENNVTKDMYQMYIFKSGFRNGSRAVITELCFGLHARKYFKKKKKKHHTLKQKRKRGLKQCVTKLMRLHYHLGFNVYVTLHFMVS